MTQERWSRNDIQHGGGNGGNRGITSKQFNGLLQPMPGQTGAKIFLEPGETIEDLCMRTVIPNFEIAKDYAITIAKFREYNMKDAEKLFKILMELNTSVGGRARDDALQAITGVVVPQIRQSQKITDQAKE